MNRFEITGKLVDPVLDCCCKMITPDGNSYVLIGNLSDYIDANDGDLIKVTVEVVEKKQN